MIRRNHFVPWPPVLSPDPALYPFAGNFVLFDASPRILKKEYIYIQIFFFIFLAHRGWNFSIDKRRSGIKIAHNSRAHNRIQAFGRPFLLNPSAFRLLFHSTAISPSLEEDRIRDAEACLHQDGTHRKLKRRNKERKKRREEERKEGRKR